MKHLLVNCDQVFDVLTRGPFPTGAPDDEAVEQHLRACHDCRQLAEALRPAVSLLHEAVTADESAALPEYQGSLPAAIPWQATLSSQSSADSRPVQRAPSTERSTKPAARSIDALRLIAASVLVAALSLLVYSAAIPAGTEQPFRAASRNITLLPQLATAPAGVPDERGLLRLASLRLPGECLPPQHRDLLASDPAGLATALVSGQLGALRCCTECHRAGPQSASNLHVAVTIKESCIACHRS